MRNMVTNFVVQKMPSCSFSFEKSVQIAKNSTDRTTNVNDTGKELFQRTLCFPFVLFPFLSFCHMKCFDFVLIQYFLLPFSIKRLSKLNLIRLLKMLINISHHSSGVRHHKEMPLPETCTIVVDLNNVLWLFNRNPWNAAWFILFGRSFLFCFYFCFRFSFFLLLYLVFVSV